MFCFLLQLHDPLRVEKEGVVENIFVCDKCPSTFNKLSNLVSDSVIPETYGSGIRFLK